MLEIIKRTDDVRGFQILPHRWMIERTFPQFNKQQRLAKDYERACQTSEAWIYLAKRINLEN